MASSHRPFSWRDRYPEQVTCVRCLQVKDVVELDRLLWCEECRAAAKTRAAFWGWIGGFVIAAALSTYIWVAIQPSDLIIRLWMVIPIAALYLAGRIIREIVFGFMRYENRRAVDAVPPGGGATSGSEMGPGAD